MAVAVKVTPATTTTALDWTYQESSNSSDPQHLLPFLNGQQHQERPPPLGQQKQQFLNFKSNLQQQHALSAKQQEKLLQQQLALEQQKQQFFYFNKNLQQQDLLPVKQQEKLQQQQLDLDQQKQQVLNFHNGQHQDRLPVKHHQKEQQLPQQQAVHNQMDSEQLTASVTTTTKSAEILSTAELFPDIREDASPYFQSKI
jgi:hypothetical protein